jgi:phospholipid-binding lipoprotein MlaA
LLRIFTLLFAGYFTLMGSVLAATSPAVGESQNVAAAVSTGAQDGTSADDFDADFDADFADDFDNSSTTPERLIADPLEPFNRGVFWVNDKLYFYFFKPVARGYRLILPRPARVSVSNFFSNLATPIRAGNALLQLKFRSFGTELYRFVINTTFGIGGLFDPAANIGGVRKTPKDFGQTLGYYHVGPGFYLVLPIVGPSSLRDATGAFVDSFADPLRRANLNTRDYLAIKFLDAENRLSLDQDTYEGIVSDSLDPYLFIRSAYAQLRQAQISQNSYDMKMFEEPVFDTQGLDPLEWIGF